MKYAKWYFLLIDRAKARGSDVVVGERHHIVPKTLGGSNEKSNLVKLTYREHFLAHWLLVKFTCGQDKRKMNHALFRMTGGGGNRPILNGWRYERAKLANTHAMKVAMIGNTRTKGMKLKLSPEARAKISSTLKGRKITEETRAKIGAAHKGKKLSPEARAKISAVNIGNTNAKGWKPTDEQRARMGAPHLGKKRTAEIRARISATLLGKPSSLKGRKLSAETRAKISAALKGKRKGDCNARI